MYGVVLFEPSAPSFADVMNPVPTAPIQASVRQFELDTILLSACKSGDFILASLAIGDGANVDYISEGDSCLIHATRLNHLSIVKLLLEKSVCARYAPESGHNALFVAVIYGHDEIVRTLLNARVQINPRDQNGGTPLCQAALKNHLSTVKILLEYGARVDIYTNGNTTPLMHAVSHQNYEMVKLSLEHGAKVDVASIFVGTVWNIVSRYPRQHRYHRYTASRIRDLLKRYQ